MGGGGFRSGSSKLMLSDYPVGVTLFPAKNLRPGPDPGGGGGGGGIHTNMGQVQVNQRPCQQQQQQTTYNSGIQSAKTAASSGIRDFSFAFLLSLFTCGVVVLHSSSLIRNYLKTTTQQQQLGQGSLMVVAGGSSNGKMATTSTDDDEEYFEPSKTGRSGSHPSTPRSLIHPSIVFFFFFFFDSIGSASVQIPFRSQNCWPRPSATLTAGRVSSAASISPTCCANRRIFLKSIITKIWSVVGRVGPAQQFSGPSSGISLPPNAVFLLFLFLKFIYLFVNNSIEIVLN